MNHLSNPIFLTFCAVFISACSLIYVIIKDNKRDSKEGMVAKVNRSYCELEMKAVRNNIKEIEKDLENQQDCLNRGNKRFTKTEKCLIVLVEEICGKGKAAEMGLLE